MSTAFPLNAWRRFISPGIRSIAEYILDTHDHPVIDPVWMLYARAIERCGPTATLLEWDDNIPSFEEVHAEALKANHYLQRAETPALPMAVQSKESRLLESAR